MKESKEESNEEQTEQFWI